MTSTPMMAQFRRIKAKHSDAVLFYRMGDFYEMFEDDAVVASKVLGLTLTSRNHGGTDKTPLCGFPFHALDRYMAKLVNAGHKVAVCEQVEDPKAAKGIVQRDIVEVVSRGTATSPEFLKEKSNNFIVALSFNGENTGFSAADVSTGEFVAGEVGPDKLLMELEKMAPSEIVYKDDPDEAKLLAPLKHALPRALWTPFTPTLFSHASAYRSLTGHFETASLEGFGVEPFKAGVSAAGALLEYVRSLKGSRLDHLKKISPHRSREVMALDGTTLRHLELVEPLHADDRETTLFAVLDATRTAMGGRLLKRMLVNPLVNVEAIGRRLDAVAFFVEESHRREKVCESLGGMGDVERLNGRIGVHRVSPRDLFHLMHALKKIPGLVEALGAVSEGLLKDAVKGLSGTEEIVSKLDRALVNDPPLSATDGDIFKPGYNAELDQIVDGTREGKAWIAGLQVRERERTGISSLKIGFNSVFGYFIEVSKANIEKVPADYVRKQTLVNGERYITEDLKHWESIVLNAEEKRKKLESALFDELRRTMSSHLEKLKSVADALGALDVFSALAHTAVVRRYVRPEVNDEGAIEIDDGRHPVVETLRTEEFVPNSTRLDSRGAFIHLITGPNMAGKSTYLRQVGLIVLMAQMGSFVPAKSARIGLVDRLFTRVGAADRLARGQSTFLVEMQELANILNNATPRSLVLLDEIGRGTSTFDGLSIAWSLVEYLHTHKASSAKTLFATHYHELTRLPTLFPGVKNFNAQVKEWNDEIVFLRTIAEGPCDESYGIQVARLAGVPDAVVQRSKEILAALENGELPVGPPAPLSKPRAQSQLSLFEAKKPDAGPGLVDDLRKLDVNRLTPIEAMNKLVELKKKAEGKKG